MKLCQSDNNVGAMQLRLIGVVVFYVVTTTAEIHAQELEPRAYSNAPIGMNFLLVGYQYSRGALIFDPSLPITDADARVNNGLFGYVRAVDVAGKSAKVGIKIPYAVLSGDGYVSGVYRTREANGIADPSFYFSANLLGAPALNTEEFRNYKQETIVGLTFKLTPPLGAYEPNKLINLGTNRWSSESQVGVSRVFGRWTLEGMAALFLYSDNDNFDSGKTRHQDPIYSVQANVVYSFKNDMWASIGTDYYFGGKTSVDGVPNNDALDNIRSGFTLALPVDKNHSFKIFGSTGVSTRTGTDYDSIGIVWQYRWGGGF